MVPGAKSWLVPAMLPLTFTSFHSLSALVFDVLSSLHAVRKIAGESKSKNAVFFMACGLIYCKII